MSVDLLEGRLRGELHDGLRPRPHVAVATRAGFHIAAAALAVLGGLIVNYATRHGMATHGDSGAYYGMAQNLRHGHGLTMPFDLATDRFTPLQVWRFRGAVPTTHFPPLYPMALALFAAGRSIWDGARTIGVLTMTLNLFFATQLAAKPLPARRRWVALMVPFVLCGALGNPPGWIIQHATVGSEPLFHTLVLGALLAFARWLERRERWALVLAGVLSAGALLTRHVGLFVVALLAASLLLTERRARSHSGGVRLAAMWGGAALAPWVAYLVYGHSAGGDGGGGLRELVVHPEGGMRTSIPRVASMWLLPPHWTDAVRFTLLALLVVAATVAIVWSLRVAPLGRPRALLLGVVASAVPVYVLTVVLARTFSDASIPLDDRMLSPIHPLLVILLAVAVGRATIKLDAGIAAVAAAAVALAVVAPQYHDQRHLVVRLAAGDGGNPYPELEFLRHVPRDTVILTSSPDVVFAVTDHPAIFTPKRNVLVAARANECYLSDFSEEVALLRRYGGYVYMSVAARVLPQHDRRVGAPTVRRAAAAEPHARG